MTLQAEVAADETARGRIRSDLDSTLFVEAGAGTGKTRELIERIVGLVKTRRAELRSVAAITFTESAAAELRDRVRERLEQAVRDDSLSEDERKACTDALDQIDAAAIETLHAFAQRILTDHPLEAGLPPIIEVQDEIPATLAFDERWAAFVDELLEDKSLEVPLLRALTLGLRMSDLRQIAEQFQEHWDRLELHQTPQAAAVTIDVRGVVDGIDAACAEMGKCTDREDKLYVHLIVLETYGARLGAATDELDVLRILAEKQAVKFRFGSKKNWMRITPDDIRETLNAAEDARQALLFAARQSALLPLLERVRRFVLEYADERRRNGRLEFHDLLVQARNALRARADVRADVRQRFSHLLIDEFQDTDPLQVEISTLIAGEEAGAPPSWQDARIPDGRLFFVGDPKQSIYRFRRADILLYQEAQRKFDAQTVRLTQNFRSVPSILAWANDAFEHLMTGGDGQAQHVALDPARPPLEEMPSVRLLAGRTEEKKIDIIREREAEEIGRLIQAVKNERWRVLDGEEERDARYQDIALLMPTRTTLPPIEHALERAGVPYRVESQSLVYDTQEVRDLLSILRAIDDPTDQVALIAALRAPAFACGDDDLLRYKNTGGRWDYTARKLDEQPDVDPVVEALRALRGLNRERWWRSISATVEAVIRERRLFELAFAHRRPRERWQRLRLVLDQARAFEEAGGRTLRQFIDWAERQAEAKTRVIETAVPEPDDDAVRIMTVHAAKGLEFPIVILCGLNLARPHGRREPLYWSHDGRPEVCVADFATEGYDAVAQVEEEMERHEKIRLLYVAATRARDHLVLSLHHKAEGKEESKTHAQLLYERANEEPSLWQPATLAPAQPPLPLPEGEPFDDSPERREAWRDQREERIALGTKAPRRSATEIAKAAAGDDPNVRKDPPVEEVPPWKRGRAGTTLGRAVHAVLQSVDLDSGSDIDSAARAQAAAEGIADRVEEVAQRARAAIESPAVREAAAGGRYWRELYVSAWVDGVELEGFVDLLYEAPDGLVVVDYKTDALPRADELDAAVARYRLQGAAYALAIEEALGRSVARCAFVFAQPQRAVEGGIDDLPEAIEEVRAVLAAARSASTPRADGRSGA